uniref:Uncharacterized protein n=1 Tax=Arundo donax TaxID=35708 RepID=A0A0A9EWG3_ARUDO
MSFLASALRKRTRKFLGCRLHMFYSFTAFLSVLYGNPH